MTLTPTHIAACQAVAARLAHARDSAAIDALRQAVLRLTAANTAQVLRDSIATRRLDSLMAASAAHAHGVDYTAVASAVAAVVAVVITLSEPWRRRRSDRTAVSVALAAEMARAWNVIREAHDRWTQPMIDLPAMFAVETQVYRSLAHQLSALPPDLLVVVVALYDEFAWLNRARGEFDRLEAQRQNGDIMGRLALPQINGLLAAFEPKMRATMSLCDTVHVRLVGHQIPRPLNATVTMSGGGTSVGQGSIGRDATP
jgi:hypothetical protein